MKVAVSTKFKEGHRALAIFDSHEKAWEHMQNQKKVAEEQLIIIDIAEIEIY